MVRTSPPPRSTDRVGRADRAPESPPEPIIFEPRPSRPRSLLAHARTFVAGGAIAGGALLLVGASQFGQGIGAWFSQTFRVETTPPKVDVRSLTIDKIRSASDLTTTVFAMEAIVPAGRDLVLGSMVVGSTKLLYIAYGEVRAGIDLSQLQPEAVTWDEASGTLKLQLPAPQILDRKIDVERSKVYDYNRGFLGLGPDAAPQLLTMAQREALQKVTAAACERGLLTEANDRARDTMARLLGTAAPSTAPNSNPIQRLEVVVTPPDPATCAIAPQSPQSPEPSADRPAADPAQASAPQPLPAPEPASDRLPVPATP
ncbi:MAG: hypothetical protein Fur0042_30100 [Cyanophyceae cyanobacterium]